MEEKNQLLPPVWMALIPVGILIFLLTINVIEVFGDAALEGANQLVLILAGFVAALLARTRKTSWDDLLEGVASSIKSSANAIFILLLIGGLAGTWMISGVVPAMINLGLQVLSPSYFLVASALVCAVVSVSTGSSWSTTATIGIALMGIGKAMGLSEAMVGGAVISGAYFGDKISPLSDTTNLAPAMAGTDLFTHIRYMMLTTVPSFAITLVIFFFLGMNSATVADLVGPQEITQILSEQFNLSPWLFLAPAVVIGLIVLRVPAIPALASGIVMGGLLAYIFQPAQLQALGQGTGWQATYRALVHAVTTDVNLVTGNAILDELLSSGGMKGMLNTVWIILSAMVFGGIMEAAGFLQSLSNALLAFAKNTFSLISTTVGTCILVNVSASDQYLAIVVPGKMFAQAYRDRGLAPQNLSRTLEDSGTVTSVLVPWNSCGAYQSGVLGVATLAYLPFCFFNLISPLMTLIYAGFNIRIARIAHQS